MVEIGLSCRMGKRPVGFAAAPFLDHCSKPETERLAEGLVRTQSGPQFMAIAGRPGFDRRWGQLFGGAHPFAISGETIGGPLARRCEIELEIAVASKRPEKSFEAGGLPEPVGARAQHTRREQQIAEDTPNKIVEAQNSSLKDGFGVDS